MSWGKRCPWNDCGCCAACMGSATPIPAPAETAVVTVAYLEELRERARAWRLEAERLQAELLRLQEDRPHGKIDRRNTSQ